VAFKFRVKKPFAGMTAPEVGVTLACRLLAAMLVLSVIVFVLRATTPFVMADAWFYVLKVIRPWQEGHLSIADFFVTRGPSDHMQPIYRLVLLMHTAWFHMDFTVEALVGVIFAIACVYLWYRLARSVLAQAPRMAVATQLTGLALVAVVFSLNARGVYDWPLVTLAFMGIFAVSALLVATPVLADRGTLPAFAGLAGLALLVFLVDDTYGILAVICAIVLLALMRLRRQVGHDAWARTTLVLVAVAIAYVAVCRVLFPYIGTSTTPRQGLAPLLTLLNDHWRESWKLLVIPTGTVIATPQRIVQGLGVSPWEVPRVLVALAIPVCVANVWFWVNYFRRKPNTLTFTAAGLMLFFYFSLAAILVSRLPRFGFDYLHEGRYMQVYELQWVAVLMMFAQTLSERPDSRVHKSGAGRIGWVICHPRPPRSAFRLRLPETHRRADRTVRGRPGRAAEKLHGEFHHALLALESGLTRRGFPDPRARTLQCFFARFPEMAQASDAWNAGGLCSAALTDAHQSAPGWRRKTQYSDSK